MSGSNTPYPRASISNPLPATTCNGRLEYIPATSDKFGTSEECNMVSGHHPFGIKGDPYRLACCKYPGNPVQVMASTGCSGNFRYKNTKDPEWTSGECNSVPGHYPFSINEDTYRLMCCKENTGGTALATTARAQAPVTKILGVTIPNMNLSVLIPRNNAAQQRADALAARAAQAKAEADAAAARIQSQADLEAANQAAVAAAQAEADALQAAQDAVGAPGIDYKKWAIYGAITLGGVALVWYIFRNK